MLSDANREIRQQADAEFLLQDLQGAAGAGADYGDILQIEKNPI